MKNISLLMFFSVYLFRASFDCNKASNDVETKLKDKV